MSIEPITAIDRPDIVIPPVVYRRAPMTLGRQPETRTHQGESDVTTIAYPGDNGTGQHAAIPTASQEPRGHCGSCKPAMQRVRRTVFGGGGMESRIAHPLGNTPAGSAAAVPQP